MFQFHKVRLEARLAELPDSSQEVFQFHKVRLEEAIELRLAAVEKFQFHKVRLEVSMR